MNEFILNQDQESVIIGSLLGDGSILKGKNYEKKSWFCKSQSRFDKLGVDKKDYVLWHSEILKEIGGSFTFYEISNQYNVRTLCHEILDPIESKWYSRDLSGNYIFKYLKNNRKQRIKIIPQDIDITPLALCIWFMDDGWNCFKTRKAEIATQSFTAEENEFLVCILKNKFDISAGICGKEKNKYHLRINAKSYVNFIKIIEPFCKWNCYKYKYDMKLYKEKTYSRGELKSKLKCEDIIKIRKMSADGMTKTKIGQIFGMSQPAISMIVSGKRWNQLINSQGESIFEN